MAERLTGLLTKLSRQESERNQESREPDNDSEYQKMIESANKESTLKEFIRDFRGA